MELKFKTQQYQTDAVENVMSVFNGQPNQDSIEYIIKNRKDTNDNTNGYKNAEVELSERKLLENIQEVQGKNNIRITDKLVKNLGCCQLDVEMETGTGKTYVYIKTMFELNLRYGWTKFIVVVPSIAIREGVLKSFKITEDHFMGLYHKKIKHFVYDSSNLSQIDNTFSQSSDICAMIINMQAFNTMKEGAKNKVARIIYEKRDGFGSRKPIEVIADNHPIVILDEPQKMGGDSTQAALAKFKPLFTLNYSATHKDHHNPVYVLDALDAYNQKLVKKIEVIGFELHNITGINGYLYFSRIIPSPNKPPRVCLEFEVKQKEGIKRKMRILDEGANLYDLSGGLEEYKGVVLTDICIDTEDSSNSHIIFSGGQRLRLKEITGNVDADYKARIQIRETIKAHFDKEENLFGKNIKCLSLFFIDEVARYRQYDAEGNQVTGLYGKIFEEEYQLKLNEIIGEENESDNNKEENSENAHEYDPAYIDYLKKITAHETHAGYFSIDKKEHFVDSETKRGGDISDDTNAYDLILKNKEKLLSLEEPVRFIFSHSALREGWDNPNVFQICSLRQSGSSAQKRQEVGRGLRLCVDNNGVRQDADVLQDDVQTLNRLTVIASEDYATFTADLQKDICADLYERPTKVDPEFFSGLKVKVLAPIEDGNKKEEEKKEEKPKEKVETTETVPQEEVITSNTEQNSSENGNENAEETKLNKPMDDNKGETEIVETEEEINKKKSGKIYYRLCDLGYIDENDDSVTETFRNDFKNGKLESLGKDLEKYDTVVYEKLQSTFDPSVIKVDNGNKVKVTNEINKELFEKFKKLWNQINHHYAYCVEFNSEELIKKVVNEIDNNMSVATRYYTVTKGVQRDDLQKKELDQGQTMMDENNVSESGPEYLKMDVVSNVRYDLLGKIASSTKLTRRTVAQILSEIKPEKFNHYKNNPEEFIKETIRIITEQKATMIVEHIKYNQVVGEYESTIFTKEKYVPVDNSRKGKKSITNLVLCDSKTEKDFMNGLENNEAIEVYAKLPKGFKIPTPVGNYSPDWAFVVDKEKGKIKDIYFVAETKGTMSSMNLKPIETSKINCAEKLFDQCFSKSVKYYKTNNFKNLWNLITSAQEEEKTKM